MVSLDCEFRGQALNHNPMCVNLANGMYDLRSDRLLPHGRGYYSTIQLPFGFDENASCPRWLQFVGEVLEHDESLIMLLQETFGYCITPDTSFQKMFWWIGQGANGKGVALRVLESLIDPSNRTSLDIRNLHNPFVRAALHNKLLSVQGDFPRKFFGNEDLVKTIVGGDTIDAQHKFEPQFEFTPFCRFIFAMNTLPDTNDKSHGFFRRVIILPFNRVFQEKEQDPHLFDKLAEELPGIFLWALKGLRRLKENKGFTVSAAATKALEDYKCESNSVGLFVESDCALSTEAMCQAKQIWEHYEVHCAESGIESLRRKEFAMQLRKNFPVTVKNRRWGEEGTQRTYFGIGLKDV
jgi:putative DNA primase/helicase